jgi:Ser/Thr protein kinase RdoA (MazF antagonist)
MRSETHSFQVPASGTQSWGFIDEPTFTAALAGYGRGGASTTLLGLSENATFRVESVGIPAAILRIYRIGHRSREAIESELAWMRSLRDETEIMTPVALPALDGRLIKEVSTSIGPAYCVMFDELGGTPPPENELELWYSRLGVACAELHLHSSGWQRPPGFGRPRLEWETIVGHQAHWGSWVNAPGLDKSAIPVLERAAAVLAERTARYGTSKDRFGLIHGDLRLQNLLIQGERVQVIDFDDCCTSWWLYDLATALSLVEDLPYSPGLLDAWLNGYRTRRTLDREDVAMIPDLIVLRRLQVLGWFGSRPESDVTVQLAPAYIPATVVAAEEFLMGRPRLRPSR